MSTGAPDAASGAPNAPDAPFGASTRTRRGAPSGRRRTAASVAAVTARTPGARTRAGAPPAAVRTAAAVTAAVLLAGCGAPAAPPAPGGPATATTTTAATPGAPQPVPVAPDLPWPAPDAAAVVALQEQVDAGSQPWLLDPAEVALSWAAAAYGWDGAAAAVPRPGTVEVTGPDGARAVLAVAQPDRTGPTGIWVVTAVERG